MKIEFRTRMKAFCLSFGVVIISTITLPVLSFASTLVIDKGNFGYYEGENARNTVALLLNSGASIEQADHAGAVHLLEHIDNDLIRRFYTVQEQPTPKVYAWTEWQARSHMIEIAGCEPDDFSFALDALKSILRPVIYDQDLVESNRNEVLNELAYREQDVVQRSKLWHDLYTLPRFHYSVGGIAATIEQLSSTILEHYAKLLTNESEPLVVIESSCSLDSSLIDQLSESWNDFILHVSATSAAIDAPDEITPNLFAGQFIPTDELSGIYNGKLQWAIGSIDSVDELQIQEAIADVLYSRLNPWLPGSTISAFDVKLNYERDGQYYFEIPFSAEGGDFEKTLLEITWRINELMRGGFSEDEHKDSIEMIKSQGSGSYALVIPDLGADIHSILQWYIHTHALPSDSNITSLREAMRSEAITVSSNGARKLDLCLNSSVMLQTPKIPPDLMRKFNDFCSQNTRPWFLGQVQDEPISSVSTGFVVPTAYTEALDLSHEVYENGVERFSKGSISALVQENSDWMERTELKARFQFAQALNDIQLAAVNAWVEAEKNSAFHQMLDRSQDLDLQIYTGSNALTILGNGSCEQSALLLDSLVYILGVPDWDTDAWEISAQMMQHRLNSVPLESRIWEHALSKSQYGSELDAAMPHVMTIAASDKTTSRVVDKVLQDLGESLSLAATGCPSLSTLVKDKWFSLSFKEIPVREVKATTSEPMVTLQSESLSYRAAYQLKIPVTIDSIEDYYLVLMIDSLLFHALDNLLRVELGAVYRIESNGSWIDRKTNTLNVSYEFVFADESSKYLKLVQEHIAGLLPLQGENLSYMKSEIDQLSKSLQNAWGEQSLRTKVLYAIQTLGLTVELSRYPETLELEDFLTKLKGLEGSHGSWLVMEPISSLLEK